MSTNTIFDLFGNKSGGANSDIEPLSEDVSEYTGQEGFFEMAKASEPEERGWWAETKNYGKNAAKAAAVGVQRLGRMASPTIQAPGFDEKFDQRLDELIPSKEGGFVTKVTERALKQLPSMLAFPGGSPASAAIRTGAAGVAGQTAQEFGAGDIGQTVAELSAYIGPGLTKRLLEAGKNKDLIKAAKQFGMSDEEIAPLLSSEGKIKWLAKLSPRRGRTQEVLKKTQDALGQVYSGLESSEVARAPLQEKDSLNLLNDLHDTLMEMPHVVREKILQDSVDLVSKPITGKSLMNYWKDINANLGGSTKQLSNLKQPLLRALKKIDPKLAEDFEWANKLYGKYSQISGRLKPNLVSDLMSLSQSLKLFGGIAFGYYPVLAEFAGEQAAKTMAREMLINPRFQQLSSKIVEAIKQNKWSVVTTLAQQLKKQVEKTSPELAEELGKADFSGLAETNQTRQK